MDINEFKLNLEAVLDKVKSIANIKRDIKTIEAKLPKIKIQGTLNSSTTKKEINTKLKSVNPKVKIDADTTLAEKKIRKINQQKTNPTITPNIDNSQVVSGLKQAQKETKTLWERFTNGIFGINLIRMGIQEITKAIRQAISNIKELDAVKTNIQMVSGTSDSGVNAMMSSYNSMAKDLSSTTKDVAEAANEFLRMGESVASTNELIKSSQVLSKVGMIESAESATYLISSLKGYKIAAEDSMDVVSKLTSVDLEAAVSAGGLAEALSKCSNIADNSGVSINRLIGYTATVGEVTQKSMSEVGNSFQSIFSRMNNIKLGIWEDENGESLSDTEKVLNKLGIQLRDTEDSYRSFDEVLDDVGSRWKDFNKVQQNAISVAFAGTRQRENFEALMNNYGDALKYAETAANSAGSALERYGVYQDSIEAKTNELTAAIESLSTNVISEDLYSGIIEATTGVVEFIDKTNLLKGTLAGLVAMGVAKTIASIGAGFITAAKSTAQLTAAMALFDNGKSVANLKAIGAACKGLSDHQLKLVLSTKTLEYEDRKLILAGMGVAEAERQQTLTTLGFANAENTATASTFSFKGALNSLNAAIASNPVGAVITSIVAAVSVATTVFSVYKQHQEELRQATEEAADAYKDSASSIEDYASRYQELHKALLAAKGDEEETRRVKEQLLDLQSSLNEKFSEAHGAINLLTGDYESCTEAIKALNKETAQTFLNENKEGIDNAEKEMTKERHYNLSYTGISAFTDEGAALKEVAEKYKDAGVTLLDELGDGSYAQFSVHLNTDAQSAYDTINAFENDLRDRAKELGDEHMFDDVLDVSSGSLNEAKETLDEYEGIYKQALTAQIASDDNKAGVYGNALKAVEEYNEAVLKSEDSYNDEDVESARKNLETVKEGIYSNEEEWGKYRSVMDDVFDQADTRLIDFNNAMQNNDELKKLVEDLNGMDAVDVQSLNPGENASFDKLRQSAKQYGLEVDELTEALIRLGYVQGEIQSENMDRNPITFNPESFSETIEALSSLQSVYNDFYENVKDNSDFTFEFSDIEALRQAFGETCAEFENFERLATSSSTSAEELQESFDKLATQYVISSLDGLNESTREQIISQLELQGIIGSSELLTEDLANAYGILADNGYTLADATDTAYWSLLDEANASEITKGSIYALAAAEIAYNNTGLDVQGKISQLGELAQAYGDTATAAIAQAAADRVANGHGDYESVYADMMASVNRAAQASTLKLGQSSANASKGKSGSKSKKETEETFDWIEKAIENLEDEISKLDKVSSSAYSSISEKNEALAESIGKINEEIDLQRQAYERYMEKAESVGLSDEYKNLVRDGAADIESITDDDLKEAIKNYEQWYDKAKETQDKINDLYDDAKDKHVEAYELEAGEIEKLREDQAITEREYLDAMLALYEKYYAAN